MKLKYKKIILLTSLSTMGIGLLTLSISQNGPKAEEQLNNTARMESGNFENDNTDGDVSINGEVSDDNNSEMMTMAAIDEGSEDAGVYALSPITTPSPTPTPVPVYPLEEVEGMDEFIEEYYVAKTACDVDKLKTLYADPSKVETREQLQSMVQYIEEYKNIKTYTKKSIEDGAYIVYAYHEIKFSSINTLAPGLSKFYVITDANGNFKIASEMEPDVEEYFNARNDDEDVLELIDMTNKRSEEAKAKDEDLMLFWNALDELAKKTDNKQEQSN